MNASTKKNNGILLLGWCVASICLLIAYLFEVFRLERDWTSLVIFLGIATVPLILFLIFFRTKKDSKTLTYWMVAGFLVEYTYALLTSNHQMVFCYILPVMALVVLYHDVKLSTFAGVGALVINAVFVVLDYINGKANAQTSGLYMIQMVLLVMSVSVCMLVARMYARVFAQNEEYLQQLGEKNGQIEKMTLQTISAIASTIDAKDEYTKGHSRRVAEYSSQIARQMGCSEDDVANIHAVALLHDIGKIGIPDSILNKPGRLTADEVHLMRQHAVIGAEILKDVTVIPNLSVGARYHHERFDGTGYPEGLAGEAIPYIARLISVADAFDAMTSNRVYRNRLSHDRVMEELKKGSGKQFDPAVLDAMFTLVDEKKLTTSTPQSMLPKMDEVTGVLNLVMEKREEQIAEKMQFDALTNTYNRSYGETLMIEAMDAGEGCLMLFDLDHFRVVNDQNGFVTGDIYLKIVAQCIRHMSNTRIISRFGGDEFCVFFRNIVSEEEAIHAVERFMEDVRMENVSRKALEGLSVSVGITLCNNRTDSFNDVLYRADKALYVAKQEGGGKYYIFHQLNESAELGRYSRNDLNQLVQLIKDKNDYEGALQISYPEFGRMFELIRKIASRNNQSIQLIMFTVLPNEGLDVTVEERDWAMDLLEKAVITCVRSVDVTTKYSSSQQIVMLMNLEEDQISIVTDRIMMEFYKMYNRKKVSIYYDIANLGEIQ